MVSRARRAAAGDTAPTLTPSGIEQFAVGEAITSAQEAKLEAVRDVLNQIADGDRGQMMAALEAVLAGASPDDAATLREALMAQRASSAGVVISPDDELSSDWRLGGYPYKNLLLRKTYENQKYRLQV